MNNFASSLLHDTEIPKEELSQVQDALYAQASATLDAALAELEAGNAEQARALVSALVKETRYEPKWGVRANGNELLAEHEAIIANASRFSEANFSHPLDGAGHRDWNGLRIRIEQKKGDIRTGIGEDGKPWAVRMPAAYGEITWVD